MGGALRPRRWAQAFGHTAGLFCRLLMSGGAIVPLHPPAPPPMPLRRIHIIGLQDVTRCSLDDFQEVWHPFLHTNEAGRLSTGKMESRCNALHRIRMGQLMSSATHLQYIICCGKGKVQLPPIAD